MIIVSFPGNAIKSEPAFLYQHNVRFCYVKHIIDYPQQSLAYNRLGKLQLYTYMRPKKKNRHQWEPDKKHFLQTVPRGMREV